MRNLICWLVLSLLLFACTGKESFEKDHTPPQTPTMIPHIGDLGDGSVTYSIETPAGTQQVTVVVNDNNNGITSVSAGDWIKIQWSPLLDSDLNYLEIWRYREEEGNNIQPVCIDSVSINQQETYIDHTLDQVSGAVTEANWFYFIKVIDQAGNSSVSDTVGYRLLEKPVLQSPSSGAHFSQGDGIDFEWSPAINNEATHYRVFIFDSSHNVMWQDDIFDTDPDQTTLTDTFGDSSDETLLRGLYYWRVDVFGNGVLLPSGSKSTELPFYYGE